MPEYVAFDLTVWVKVRVGVKVRVRVRVGVRVRARARVRARVRVRVRAPGAACRRAGWSGATARVGSPGYRRS